MPKPFDRWTVLPHGPLERVDEGIVTVTGEIPMPLGNFPRRMTAVTLRDGSLAIFSAMALREEDMARLEALGRPAFLIVPNAGHRLDARIWKQRFPDIHVITPPGGREAVSEVVPVDSTGDDLGDPDVHFWVVPGTNDGEAALTVRRESGITLICNDIIGHVRHPHGIGAQIMARLFGYGVSEPRVPRTIRRYIKQPQALANQFADWAQTPDLQRIIVSHGEPITDHPAQTLRRLAAELQGTKPSDSPRGL